MDQRVAIVHDWLTSMRGGERVVEALYRVFPRADLFTLTWDPARLSPALARRQAITSPIHRVARAPFVNGHFRALLPFFPLAMESFDLDGYQLVVSSTHCVAIGAIAPPTALHIAYVHSTLRYVREGQPIYEASVPGGPVGRALFRCTARYLRSWETVAARRPHVLIANSTYTRERIRRYFRRDARLIEPPIETGRFERAASDVALDARAPFLLVSSLVPNKRVDLALRAFEGRPERLIVVGEGPERRRLARLAGPNVTLSARVSDAELAKLYAGAQALLHTAVDDFGMVMVEALAAGKPVLACAEGGALDIVRDGENGILIRSPTVDSVRAALDRFARISSRFDPAALRIDARRFDTAQFERRFREAVEEAVQRKERLATASDGSSWRSKQSDFPMPLATTHGAAAPVVAAHPASAFGVGIQETTATRDPVVVRQRVAKHSRAALKVKRFADVLLAGYGLVFTAPLTCALAALIPLTSPGPALFFQRRTGLDQRTFTLVKLRTMDAEGRITGLGRWLRPMGLDELPQFWNVLKGDMSLVGPRPELLDSVAAYDREFPEYHARHFMRPGITGWAQVNGLRGNLNLCIADRLRCDLHYVCEWSLALDVRILARTVSTVVSDTLRSLQA